MVHADPFAWHMPPPSCGALLLELVEDVPPTQVPLLLQVSPALQVPLGKQGPPFEPNRLDSMQTPLEQVSPASQVSPERQGSPLPPSPAPLELLQAAARTAAASPAAVARRAPRSVRVLEDVSV